jgi:hypothetical protein
MQYSAFISRSKSKLPFKRITHFSSSYVTIRPDNQYDTKPHGFRFHSSKTEPYFQISIGKLSSKQVTLADKSKEWPKHIQKSYIRARKIESGRSNNRVWSTLFKHKKNSDKFVCLNNQVVKTRTLFIPPQIGFFEHSK